MPKALSTLSDEQLRVRCDRAHGKATRLAEALYQEVLPSDRPKSQDAQRHLVGATLFTQILPGDVLLVHEASGSHDEYRGKYGREGESVADFASRWGVHHVVVVRRTALTLWVKPLVSAHHYLGDSTRPYDPFDLQFVPTEELEYDPEYQWRESHTRYLVDVGNREVLQTRVRASRTYGRFVSARDAYAAIQAEQTRRWEAEAEIDAREENEAQAKVDLLNDAAGFEVYEVGFSNNVERTHAWAKVPEQAIQRLMGTNYQTEVADLFEAVEKETEA